MDIDTPLLAHMPTHIRDAARAGTLPVVPTVKVETSEDATDRLQRAAAAREAQYRACLPSRYATATLASLRPQQDPDGRVSGWWESGGQHLVALGPSRHGKTWAMWAVLRHARETADAHVLGGNLVSLIESARPGREDNHLWDRVHACDLLLVDDLGREATNDWVRERVYELVEHRASAGLRTIFTTNELSQVLIPQYGVPVVERIQEGASFVRIEGERLAVPSAW